jgi:hypothetical protein
VPSQTFSVLPARSGKSCSWLLLEEEHGYPLRQRAPAITLKKCLFSETQSKPSNGHRFAEHPGGQPP